MLRQRSRPYVLQLHSSDSRFAGIEMFDMMASNDLQDRLHENTGYCTENGGCRFDIKPTRSAICAIMLYI